MTYRLRLTNMGGQTGLRVYIEGHDVTVISIRYGPHAPDYSLLIT